MKGFFENLFGKKPLALDAEKRAELALLSPSQPVFEPYKRGDVIGGTFEVQRKLGEGGFGVVYLVRHRETDDVFALKTFRDELLADPATRESFKKEALLWCNLQSHPF
jgi:serine/threonine protein kinase